MGFVDGIQHAWNAFMNKEPDGYYSDGASYSYRPDRVRLTRGNEAHPAVPGTNVLLTADVAGTVGNAIAISDTMANAALASDATELSGGIDGTVTSRKHVLSHENSIMVERRTFLCGNTRCLIH